MEFNKFNMYSLSAANESLTDSEQCMRDLMSMDNYNQVANYINKKLHGIQRDELSINYPVENNSIIIRRNDERIEVFMLNDNKLLKSKGWLKQ